MTNTNTDSITAINVAMDSMTSAFSSLKSLILDKQNSIVGSIICPETGTEIAGDSRENLIKALGDWDIHSTSNAGEVVRYPGYFAVCKEIINAIHDFNEAKKNLTTTTKSLISGGVTEREMRNAYNKNGFAVIHPLQARRLIRIVDGENLKRISFSIAKRVEGIEKITAKLAFKRLENNNAYDILSLLANLSPDDIVRWHKPIGSHIRANVVHQTDGADRQTKMMHSSLPIMIDGSVLPEIVFNQPKDTRKKRSDTLAKNRIELPFVKGGYLSFEC